MGTSWDRPAAQELPALAQAGRDSQQMDPDHLSACCHGQAGPNRKITPNLPLQTINPNFFSTDFPELLSRSLSHLLGFSFLAPGLPFREMK